MRQRSTITSNAPPTTPSVWGIIITLLVLSLISVTVVVHHQTIELENQQLVVAQRVHHLEQLLTLLPKEDQGQLLTQLLSQTVAQDPTIHTLSLTTPQGGSLFHYQRPPTTALSAVPVEYTHLLNLNGAPIASLTISITPPARSLFWLFDIALLLITLTIMSAISYIKGRQQQRDQAHLYEQQQHYKSIFDNAPLSLILTDSGGSVVDVNAYHQHHICQGRCRKDELVGHPLHETLAIATAELFDHYLQVLRGMPLQKEGVYFPPSQNTVEGYFDIIGVPLVGAGRINGALFIHVNVTQATHNLQRLHETEGMLRQIIDTIPMQLYWKNRELAYMGCNSRFVTDVGCSSPMEIIHKSDADLVWSDPTHQDDQQVLKSGEAKLYYEESLPSRNGSPRWIESSKVPLRDNRGEVIGILGVYQDISQRKQLAAELDHYRHQLTQMVETRTRLISAVAYAAKHLIQSEGEWESQIDHVLQQLGQAAAANRISICRNHAAPSEGEPLLFTIVHEWVDGTTPFQRHNPDLQGCSYERQGLQRWQQALSQGQILHGLITEFPATEQTLLQSMGIQSLVVAPIFAGPQWWGFTCFSQLSHPRVWEESELQVITTAAESIGSAIHQQQHQRTLQRVIHEQEMILQNSTIGIAFLKNRHFIHLNPRMVEMFGWDEIELKGLTTEQLHPSTSAYEEFGRQAIPILSRGETFHADLQLKRKDNSLFWCRLSGKCVDPSGNSGESIWVLDDISQQRQESDELQQAKLAAERANRSKSDFLAKMSHEIRTPMNGVLGMVELLLRTPTSEQQTHYINTIRRSGHTLMTVINDILDFSKIEAGKLTLERHPYNPAEVLHDIQELLSPRLTHKGLTLRLEISPDLPQAIWGDPSRLNQIIYNLVGNAIKFTSQGEISVRASINPPADSLQLIFEIEDHGRGIEAEKLPHLFDAFYQAHSGEHWQHSGTGLGLAICKSLVEAMGGKIGVDSELGRGSRFWFTITYGPAHTEQLIHLQHQEEQEKRRGQRRHFNAHILIAEDNHVNQDVASGMLTLFGCSYDVVENGQQAIDRFRQGGVDLILMDLNMPIMDGESATQQIRTLEQQTGAKPLPIIALTAHAISGVQQRCIEAGMDGVLSKPFSIPQLSSVLNQYLTPQPQAESSTMTSTPPSPSSQSILDPTALQTLLQIDPNGENGLIAEMIGHYLDQSPALLLAIEQGEQQQQPEQIRKAAHSLKSSSATLGATALAELCREIEQRGQAGQCAGERVQQAKELYQQVEQQLRGIVSNGGKDGASI